MDSDLIITTFETYFGKLPIFDKVALLFMDASEQLHTSISWHGSIECHLHLLNHYLNKIENDKTVTDDAYQKFWGDMTIIYPFCETIVNDKSFFHGTYKSMWKKLKEIRMTGPTSSE
tara:strand:- start:154 stop:504 length:351 start_codon:yes stop_codon:yes gene_type:complete